MKMLAFAASLRAGSLNRRLVELAARIAREHGAAVDLADLREFDMPLYDGDVEVAEGLPTGALELARRIREADALMIASPEYNYSISGVLKNAIDWTSRARPMPWRGRSVYLLAAAPSPMGGIRGLWQTRIPLEGCGALVFPDMFALAHAAEAFDGEGGLRDAALAARLEREVAGFVRLAEALVPICKEPTSDEQRRQQKVIEAGLEDETELQPPQRVTG